MFLFIFIKNLELFERSDSEEFSYKFHSNINPSIETLDIMFFIGKIMAKALLDNLTINTCFNKLIYKMLLEEKVTLDDLIFIDKPVNIIFKFYKIQLYNSMKELKKLKDFEDLGIYFNVEYLRNGKLVSEDLIPNGSNIQIDSKNIDQYISKR